MTQAGQQVEVHLSDIWTTLKLHKRIVTIPPVICGVVAYILAAQVLTPKWEVSAILQVGQVGQIGQVVQSGPKLVEPASNVVARIMHPSFSRAVLNESNLKPGDLPLAKSVFQNSLKVTKIKDTDLIEIKLKACSAEMARTLGINVIGYLQKAHDELMVPGVARIKGQIQNTNEEIQKLNVELNFLKQQLLAKHDWNSYNATLAATVLQDKSNQLRELTQRKLLLNEQLSPSVTFTTKVVGDISVSEEPVSPNKPLIAGFAALIGLLCGIFIAFARNAESNKIA